jgi:YVTN family beta-propeller protein
MTVLFGPLPERQGFAFRLAAKTMPPSGRRATLRPVSDGRSPITGRWLRSSHECLSNVSVIATATNTVTAIISVGTAPFGAEVTPDGSKVLGQIARLLRARLPSRDH